MMPRSPPFPLPDGSSVYLLATSTKLLPAFSSACAFAISASASASVWGGLAPGAHAGPEDGCQDQQMPGMVLDRQGRRGRQRLGDQRFHFQFGRQLIFIGGQCLMALGQQSVQAAGERAGILLRAARPAWP